MRAIFFVKHAETNCATRLGGREALRLLAPNLIWQATAADGGQIIKSRESLNLVLTLVERIPCYELCFKPDFGFWECIEQLFGEESALAIGKG